ncbi:hypothetical protein LguiA_021561 [Lonicera macranthoides]
MSAFGMKMDEHALKPGTQEIREKHGLGARHGKRLKERENDDYLLKALSSRSQVRILAAPTTWGQPSLMENGPTFNANVSAMGFSHLVQRWPVRGPGISRTEDWSSALYSIIYTSIPTFVVGTMDKDLNRKTLLKYPKHYGAGYRSRAKTKGEGDAGSTPLEAISNLFEK